MMDILRQKFDTVLLFLLVLAFAGLSIHWPVFIEFDKEVLAAFLALVSRDVVQKLRSENGQPK